MAYIVSPLSHPEETSHSHISQISVNASIVSDSGGTCVCNGPNNCATDETYLACVQEVKQDLITSTAAISALASVLMGALANLPVGMAPGMGLNAYVCRLRPPGVWSAYDYSCKISSHTLSLATTGVGLYHTEKPLLPSS